MVLNAAMADALDDIANELEKATGKGEDLNKAVGKLLTKIIKEHKRIIFNGNNYSAEWQKEAAKRKLLNLKNTVDALPQLVTTDAIKLLERFKILNAREVHARYEVFLENYNKTINVEGQLMVLMANRYILPAALEYQKQIGQSVAAVKAGGASSVQGKKLLQQYTKLVDRLKAQTDALAAALDHGDGSAEKHAKYMRDKIVPGDGEAARDRRRDRGADAARDLAAADLPRDAVREVGSRSRSFETFELSGGGSWSGPSPFLFTGPSHGGHRRSRELDPANTSVDRPRDARHVLAIHSWLHVV